MRVLYATVAAAVLAATTLGAQAARNKREGIWIGIGAGPGNAGTYCDQCPDDRTWGFSGSVRIGGTIASNLLLGFETNGLLGSVDSVDSRLGFASVTGTLFPSQYNNFYVKIGLGGMKYYAAQVGTEVDALAPSVMAGIGYEFEVGRGNLVVVPYFNYLASTSVDVQVNGQPVPTSTISVNLFQFGLGLLWR